MMTKNAAERRAELEALAREISSQVAWDMALEGQAISDDMVSQIERETLDRLLATDISPGL